MLVFSNFLIGHAHLNLFLLLLRYSFYESFLELKTIIYFNYAPEARQNIKGKNSLF